MNTTAISLDSTDLPVQAPLPDLPLQPAEIPSVTPADDPDIAITAENDCNKMIRSTRLLSN
jgi:hypothetical protein